MKEAKRLENIFVKGVRAKLKAGKGKAVTIIHDVPNGVDIYNLGDMLAVMGEEILDSELQLSYRVGIGSIFIMITDVDDGVELP